MEKFLILEVFAGAVFRPSEFAGQGLRRYQAFVIAGERRMGTRRILLPFTCAFMQTGLQKNPHLSFSDRRGSDRWGKSDRST